MKITVIYGTAHKGSTYNIAQLLLKKLIKHDDEISEFVLPRDMHEYCCGCFNCFLKGEQTCPHSEQVNPIRRALEEAHIIILASPVYVYGMSGQLKGLLDHFAYQWMPHRPNPKMFNKVGVVISTAAGMGTAKTNKAMKDNLFYWGVPKIFSYGKSVGAMNWEGVNAKKKLKIEKDISILSSKIIKAVKSARPSLTMKFIFCLMRLSQKNNNWNLTDKKHWETNGWLEKKRPW